MIIFVILITLLLITRPDSETVCDEEEPKPKPKLYLKVYTKNVWPGQRHGDWFARHIGLKNKITIYNKSDKILKIITKPHALFNSMSARDVSCVCNTEYDEGEETLFPGETHKVTTDTHRCNIEIMHGDNRVFKKLCSSSENIFVEEKMIDLRSVYRRSLFSCCVPRVI